MRETLADKIEAMQRRMVAGTALARRKALQASAERRQLKASAEVQTEAADSRDERVVDSAKKP